MTKPKRSKARWLKHNRGSKTRHMATHKLGQPVWPLQLLINYGLIYIEPRKKKR